jgi:DNA-directed RNA polymerase specialized sigma24 family protein
MSENATAAEPREDEKGEAERPVEERAEEIVERVSQEVTRFIRRLVARTREELEDIVAEAQSIRRGEGPRD